MSSFGFFKWAYAETDSVVLYVDQPDADVGSLNQPPMSAQSSFNLLSKV